MKQQRETTTANGAAEEEVLRQQQRRRRRRRTNSSNSNSGKSAVATMLFFLAVVVYNNYDYDHSSSSPAFLGCFAFHIVSRTTNHRRRLDDNHHHHHSHSSSSSFSSSLFPGDGSLLLSASKNDDEEGGDGLLGGSSRVSRGGGENGGGSFDRNEFEMQVGRAMDALRTDYNDFLLLKHLDYSIYHTDLELIDPSGVHLHGVKNYENAIKLVHGLIGVFYCPETSGLTFRMCFDKARQNIRIHWNARVIPKAIFGGKRTTLYLDGISIYELDRSDGSITQHKLERLVMNDNYLTPEQGVFTALRRHAKQAEIEGVPALNTRQRKDAGVAMPGNVLRFHNHNPFSSFSSRGSLLFDDDENDNKGDDNTPGQHRSRLNAMSSSSSSSSDDPSTSSSSTSSSSLEKKNAIRKKYGLKPMSMEEFIELEGRVEELDHQQKQKAAAAAFEFEQRAAEQQKKKGGFFGNLFGDALRDTCETNYDCVRPEVCCDFGIKKMCCSSGMRILDGPPNPNSRYGNLAEVPVPLQNPNPYPPGDPRNRDPY